VRYRTQILQRWKFACGNLRLSKGESAMGIYRLYTLDAAGRFISRKDLTCENDAAALQAALNVSDTAPMELWTEARLVASIAPKDAGLSKPSG
jgi:hypothetical protein